MMMVLAAVALAAGSTERTANFDFDWMFHRGDPIAQSPPPPSQCEFPTDLHGLQCIGLIAAPSATTEATCAAACCAAGPACVTWQLCNPGSKCYTPGSEGCWIGKMDNCHASTNGWTSKSRASSGPPAHPTKCSSPFCMSKYDDSAWSPTETPHDYSIENLPSRAEDQVTPVLEVRNGTWLFYKGDGNFSDPAYDDGSWMKAPVPHTWSDPPVSYSNASGMGWYRRHIAGATAAQLRAAAAGTLELALGTVSGSDETYLNGVKIGNTGNVAKAGGSCTSFIQYRSYDVPAGLLKPDGNVVAVRVRGGGDGKPSGLFDSMAPDDRVGPFDPAASPGKKQTGYTVSGIGWYRKTFSTAADAAEQRRTTIRFDGVYMNADIYLNDQFLTNHPYGYTTFDVDVTKHLKPAGGKNVLAVRVSSMGSNSRWYAGAGIFRHVWLITTPDVFIAPWGVSAVTPQASIDLKAKTATTVLTTVVRNAGTSAVSVVVTAALAAPTSGLQVGAAQSVTVHVPANGTATASASFALTAVRFWGTDTPHLYTAAVSLSTGDTDNVTFGIRQISFDSKNGFLLNGVETKLQGGCVHHANGPLGSKTLDRAEERRVQVLKEAGYNAIRTSHNPVSPAFVAACDKLGMLLMEEAFDCWEWGKNSDDYHVYFDEWWQRDIASMVQRDINSPSIIMWSIGNEIPMRDSDKGRQLSKELADFVRTLDPMHGNGRAVTSAYPGVGDSADKFLAPLDVAGYNYSPQRYQLDHKRDPSRVIVATESFPLQSFSYWEGVWDNEWVIGDFIWTAIDYIGESAIGGNGFNTPDLRACGGYCPQGWSWHISFCGDIDIVGLQKPQSLYRQVLWNVSPLQVSVHAPVAAGQHEVVASWGWPDERSTWTWNEVKPGFNMSVNVYSRSSTVALMLNGNAVTPAPQPVSAKTQFTATFTVPYAPGKLTAVGYDANGKQVSTKTLVSAGAATKLVLRADRSKLRADRSDLSYVTAAIVDAEGNVQADNDVLIRFKVTGQGELAAVGTGDPADATAFSNGEKMSYRGQVVAILRPGAPSTAPTPGGSITLTATADGLAPATITVTF